MSLSGLLNRQKLGMIILYCVLYLASKNINNKIQIIYFDEKNQLILIYSLAAFLFSPLHYLKQIVSKLAARRKSQADVGSRWRYNTQVPNLKNRTVFWILLCTVPSTPFDSSTPQMGTWLETWILDMGLVTRSTKTRPQGFLSERSRWGFFISTASFRLVRDKSQKVYKEIFCWNLKII